jgi:NAD(P)H-dependent FMN reductase
MAEFLRMANREGVTMLVGSLREDSVNRAAAKQAAQLLGQDFTIHQPDLSEIPLFDQDLEHAGDPESVLGLKGAVAESAVVICFTPEYNYSTSGVLKNAIDWLSRPFRSGSLIGRVVAIASATPGSKGGENAREHLLQTCGVLTDRLYSVTLGIPNVTHLEGGALPHHAADLIPPWLDGLMNFHRAILELTHTDQT